MAIPPILFAKDTHEPYQLTRELGRGAHAAVWGAVTKEGEKVAIKVHKVGRDYFDETVREGEHLRKLQGVPNVIRWIANFDLAPECCPKIVSALKLGVLRPNEQVHAIVMERLPCKNTYELLIKTRTQGLAYKQVIAIAQKALETLGYFRLKGLVHTDIKPDNLAFRNDTGELFFFDFGFLKKIHQVDPDHRVQARAYRAPERLQFQTYDDGIDLWSLGICLFELYTKTNLFLIGESDDHIQTTIDHWHLLIHILEKKPSRKFIDASRFFYKNLFKEGQSCELAYPPRNSMEKMMFQFEKIKEYHPDVPIWQGLIYEAAMQKNESKDDARRLIELIDPMLRYDQRPSPNRCLRYLNRTLKQAASKEGL